MGTIAKIHEMLVTKQVSCAELTKSYLDEIEKAHTDVFNLLLQVMDEGRLTDSLGRYVDFKNTIIIMTSNIGTRQLKDFGSGIGFKTQEIDKEYTHGVLTKALNKTFAPEFLNRIDDIIMFDALDKEAISNIIDIELATFISRINNLGYTITITDAAKNFCEANINKIATVAIKEPLIFFLIAFSSIK